jgi:splicing factor 3A subunit 1
MEIDWNDFVVVGTVELTETDAHIDLPPPMSLRDIENMSMAQKRMAAMIMEVEGGDADESKLLGLMDVPGGEGASAGASEPVRAKPSQMNPERAAYAAGASLPARPGSGAVAQAQDEDDVEMDMDDDSDEEPAPVPQVEGIKRADGQAPMRVRKGYVPKTLADRKAAADAQTTKCPVCGEQIPLSEMDEHVRIELLNPKFREQRQELETKRAQHNALQEGADPSRFLRQFAGARTDIFGAEAEEDARKRREEQEAQQRREREKIIWDGHANSRTATRDTFNKTSQVEETMAQIQRKFNVGAPEANIGPQVPGMAAAGPSTMAPPAGPSGSAPSIHPSRLASGIDPSAALKRPAEGYPAGQPDAQRHAGLPTAPAAMGALQPPPDAPTGPSRPGAAQVNVNSLPKQSSGALYDENMWLRYNPYPIALKVTFPDAPATSPLCDGRTEVFAETPMTATIASVRDRVHAMLDGAVGASKLKLKIGGKAATLKQTLAHWNLLDNDEIVVSLGK